jgi:primary-amine oxidase
MAHPLHLLTAEEIRSASSILLHHVQQDNKPAGQDLEIHFKNISLHDPPKALLLPYLDAEASGTPAQKRPYVPRCVDIIWSTGNGRKVTESTVSLNARKVITETHAAKGQHGPNDRYASSQH